MLVCETRKEFESRQCESIDPSHENFLVTVQLGIIIRQCHQSISQSINQSINQSISITYTLQTNQLLPLFPSLPSYSPAHPMKSLPPPSSQAKPSQAMLSPSDRQDPSFSVLALGTKDPVIQKTWHSSDLFEVISEQFCPTGRAPSVFWHPGKSRVLGCRIWHWDFWCQCFLVRQLRHS